jgi:hypothetical protein
MQLSGEHEKGLAVNNETNVIVFTPQVRMHRRLTIAAGGHHGGKRW